jgi:hypothetical protein
MSPMAGHVASDRLGEASLHGGLETLREEERHHVQGCDSCRRLYGGYRLADRLLAAPWREVKVPVGAATRPSRFAFVGDFVRGLDARSVAPVAAAIGLVVLIGAAVALPQLIPVTPVSSHSPIASRPTATASPSPSAPAHLSPVPSSSAQAGRTPGAQASGNGSSNGGPGATTPAGPTSAPSAEASAQLAVSKISGSPIAWSPDGAHLLLWAAGFAHEIQICDAAGHVTGTAAADAATWVSSTTVAVATRAPIGPSGRSGGSRGGSGGSGEMVVLVNVHGQVTRTLPGRYTLFGGVANGMLLGSGSGELTIEGAGGGTSSGSGFVLWNGSLSGVQDGLPIAFSADGRKLAVLDLSGVSGGSVTGTLEILSIPSLSTSASFDHLNLRVGSGSLGSAFGFDAAFSPNGASLLPPAPSSIYRPARPRRLAKAGGCLTERSSRPPAGACFAGRARTPRLTRGCRAPARSKRRATASSSTSIRTAGRRSSLTPTGR